ncbi:unnamed protein product, partial [Heligmosomoides polygyrus]|uniref:3-deoxy-7-phosphoheptulonate synthase n=1 Tax=Heligmosomoides polygyrus TaxID=6339 RepID=A0A183F3X0_HELPZ
MELLTAVSPSVPVRPVNQDVAETDRGSSTSSCIEALRMDAEMPSYMKIVIDYIIEARQEIKQANIRNSGLLEE